MSNIDTTLCLDEMLHLGADHVDSLVGADGRTYFDVFLTEPAEAIMDWPDFVDLPARYWEAAIMIEEATGRRGLTKERVREWLFSHFADDGLAYRPDGPISTPIPEMFDQSRLLYSLVSVLMHSPDDEEVRKRTISLIEALLKDATYVEDYAYIGEIGIYFGGTLIRPLVQAGLVCQRPDWVEFGGKLARGLFHHSDLIAADGSFKGHVHGALSAIAGALAYAIVKGDDRLLERAHLGFKYAVSISTNFGFVPELAQRKDDMIACETCTLMDYLDVALLLARHVDESYWDLVEKAARNHLWESQIRDASWLPGSAEAIDEDDVIRRDLATRMRGAFAGWSAPHCMLAYHEHHGCGWMRKPEKKALYLDKIRAVQNCCAGGGIRAVFQIWSNIVTREGDTVRVNLSLDRSTEDIDVTSFLPFDGSVHLRLKKDAILRWRYPSHVSPASVSVDSSEGVDGRVDGAFLDFGFQKAGTQIAVRFSLPEASESVVIGNQGAQQYRFQVDWRGDTILGIAPDPTNARTGYTGLMDRSMPTSYGDAGIGPIYQRQQWRKGNKPKTNYPVATNRRCYIDWYSLRGSV